MAPDEGVLGRSGDAPPLFSGGYGGRYAWRYRSHLGLPNLIVLTVTTDDARLADIVRRGEFLGVHHGAFLFKAIGAKELRVPARSLLTEPWERIGQPALRIDQ